MENQSIIKSLSDSDIISLTNTYLTFSAVFVATATLIVAVVTIALTYYYSRDKKKLIKETSDAFLSKIIENEKMRNDFINKILKNNEFMQEFERMVDIHISDKMDRISVDTQEKSNIRRLQ